MFSCTRQYLAGPITFACQPSEGAPALPRVHNRLELLGVKANPAWLTMTLLLDPDYLAGYNLPCPGAPAAPLGFRLGHPLLASTPARGPPSSLSTKAGLGLPPRRPPPRAGLQRKSLKVTFRLAAPQAPTPLTPAQLSAQRPWNGPAPRRAPRSRQETTETNNSAQQRHRGFLPR